MSSRVDLSGARGGGLRGAMAGAGNFFGLAMYLRGIPCNKGGGRWPPVDGNRCVSIKHAANYRPLIKEVWFSVMIPNGG